MRIFAISSTTSANAMRCAWLGVAELPLVFMELIESREAREDARPQCWLHSNLSAAQLPGPWTRLFD
jgi:hypothetical protein